jgi:hypothetical protein
MPQQALHRHTQVQHSCDHNLTPICDINGQKAVVRVLTCMVAQNIDTGTISVAIAIQCWVRCGNTGILQTTLAGSRTELPRGIKSVLHLAHDSQVRSSWHAQVCSLTGDWCRCGDTDSPSTRLPQPAILPVRLPLSTHLARRGQPQHDGLKAVAARVGCPVGGDHICRLASREHHSGSAGCSGSGAGRSTSRGPGAK